MSWKVGSTNVRIGRSAGHSSQDYEGIAIGSRAAENDQGKRAISLGVQAGQMGQSELGIAIGGLAAASGQQYRAIAIGANAGQTDQSQNAVALGVHAGLTGQGDSSVAIGKTAAETNQGDSSVAIGNQAGRADQGELGIAIGANAASTNQDYRAIAIGTSAGWTDQGNYSVAVGGRAATESQGFHSVAVGMDSGRIVQGDHATAIGSHSGGNNQSHSAVSVGAWSGYADQGTGSVAIGFESMFGGGGDNSIAIGIASAKEGDGGDCVVIGNRAMQFNGGLSTNVVAVGSFACMNASSNNTITLNATGGGLDNQVDNSLVVKPIRNAAGPNALTYNPATGEITYATSSEATKENIHVYERDVEAILRSLVVKEFNYKNKNKYTRPLPESLSLPMTFEDWVEANHPRVPETLEGDGTEAGGGRPATSVCEDEQLKRQYAMYMERASHASSEVVDKEETHVGLIAEEVQVIAPELVYDDLEGAALDVKWTSITSMLVVQTQLLVAEVAALRKRLDIVYPNP